MSPRTIVFLDIALGVCLVGGVALIWAAAGIALDMLVR
jgi:hypothetical protein